MHVCTYSHNFLFNKIFNEYIIREKQDGLLLTERIILFTLPLRVSAFKFFCSSYIETEGTHPRIAFCRVYVLANIMISRLL